MQLRLKSHRDVRVFSIAVTLLVLCGNFALEYAFLPEPLIAEIRFFSILTVLVLATPIAYFVGEQLLRIHLLTERLKHALDHDALTGAFTRTALQDRLGRMPAGPMTVILADIDHFKAFNDRFGHEAGDLALRHVAATLMENCREDDVVARYGGEEFVILLPLTGLADGIAMARRLCRVLQAGPFVVAGTEVRLTASFGVAPVESPDQIVAALRAADGALYRAKDSGRARVCTTEGAAPPSSPSASDRRDSGSGSRSRSR